MPMRVYGLEGIVQTQDEALAQHAITLAKQDERLGGHDVAIGILTTQVTALVTATSTTNSTLNKVMWTLIGFAFTVAAAAVGVVIGA